MKKNHHSASLTNLKTFRDLILPMSLQLSRRARASAGHLITTLAASSMILALFLYIFSDFINTKLPSISPQAAANMRFYLVHVLILASSLAIVKWSRDLMFTKGNWCDFLRSIGCSSSSLKTAMTLGLMTILSLGNLATLAVINYALGPISNIHILTSLTAIIISLMFGKNPPIPNGPDQTHRPYRPSNVKGSPLIEWRQKRLSRFGWRGAHLQTMACFIFGIGFISLGIGNPKDMTLLTCLIGGNVLSWTVPLLIEEDLQFTWLERQAAVSHGDWIKAWQTLFTRRAIVVFGLSFGLYMFTSATLSLTTQTMNTFDFNTHVGRALLASALASFPCWLAPSFVLQIDGRRIFTNIVMLTLINLFVGTAMMAVPWITPALWLLQREAHRYQGGRFARASNN